MQSDDGYKETQEPLSKEELAAYSEKADDFLFKKRVLITYLPEQEIAIKTLLGIPADGEMKVVYDFGELSL